MSDLDRDDGIAKNKRKSSYKKPMDILKMSSSLSLDEVYNHGISEEKLEEFGSSEELGKHFRELQSNDDEWDDPAACQLLELLSHDLHVSLRQAIDKIAQTGYNRELAEQLILKSGLYHGLKDMVSNVVEGAFAFIKTGKDSGTSEQYVFQDLDKLVEFSLLEMVSVLRQLKPCSSVTEAMWCLFICDLNLWHALAVPRDQLGVVSFQDIPVETFSDLLLPSMLDLESLQEAFYTRHISKFLLNWAQHPPPKLKHFCSHEGPQKGCSALSYSYMKSMDLSAASMDEKSGCGRKGALSMRREMLRQKAFCFEKSYKGRMYKGCFKAKLIPAGNKALDKALKSSTGSSCAVMKCTCSRYAAPLGAGSPIFEGKNKAFRNLTPSQLSNTCHTFSAKDTGFQLPAVDPALSLNSTSIAKAEASNAGHSSEVPDYFAGITYNESLGKYIPKNDKEETILGLFSKMKALEKKIQDYTDWANEKVMQATRRLAKDQAELKMLRLEKGDGGKSKKENQTTEESTIKRVSEMEHALSNATLQFETANLALCKLEDENSALKAEAEAAEMKALRTKIDLQEASQREQETLKNYGSGDLIKASMQEELTALRRRHSDLLSQLKIAKGREEQLEDLWRREEEEKLKYLEDAIRKRSEMEREKAQAIEKEFKLGQEAERFIQKYKKDMKKLEAEISTWRALSESPRIAALLAGAGTGFACSSIGSSIAATQDNSDLDSIPQNRECIMCLTEELSVVFLPCAHQVLCSQCNDLHKKKGMMDCPSCRTTIQARINARYEKP